MVIPCPKSRLEECASGRVNWMRWWENFMKYETLKVSFVNHRLVWRDGLPFQDVNQRGKPLGSITASGSKVYGAD